eukprot:TRINITY_DN4379_c0_g1_i2.p1 TRINITY_DN4379_c0_g1~~TRINITY_DN4379_c0_g1_i2.p1  ORF type:complete len:240 (-),score=34.22 TRINITY_DN4379_c0_g1_i2:456-1175(-)
MQQKGLRILLGGATGFIGRQLCNALKQDGHTVLGVSRTSGHTIMKKYSWEQLQKPTFLLPKVDVVMNFAGTNLMAHPFFTKKFQQEIVSSRVDTTKVMVKLISDPRAEHSPPLFINASAIGYYDTGIPGPTVDEASRKGEGFFADMVQKWEAAAELPGDCKTRVVKLRLGVVMDRDADIVNKMRTAFKYRVGGHIGTGEQYFPWVHVNDIIEAVRFIIKHEDISGVYNAVAPTTPAMAG